MGPKSDLRHLTDLCSASVARCAAHEREIESLRHSIEAKLQQWDTSLVALRAASSDSANLTQTLRTSLRSLSSSTRSQLTQAKEAVSKASERVSASSAVLERAGEGIKGSEEAMASLERRLKEEEQTLQQIEAATTLMLWLSVIVILMLAAGIAWWRLG